MAARHSARQHLIDDFNRRKESSSVGNSSEHINRSMGLSISPPDQARYSPCVVPVDTLIPMAVADMVLTRHHRGRKVTLRTCTPPKRRMLGITAIAEDEHGTAIPLSLLNMPISSAIHTPDTILPNGTICIVKEPFLKSKKKEGNSSIRVDHVTDIVFLSATDSRIPDAWKQPEIRSSEAIRKQGNAYFAENDWFSALNLFSMALDAAQTDAERQLALANRALANLKAERYEAALSDATQFFKLAPPGAVLCHANQDVDSRVPVPIKTLFRLAMAHYGLQNFVQCREALVKLLSAFPNEKEAKPALVRVDARLHEQRTGGYSFTSIYEQGTYKKAAGKKDADKKNADEQDANEQDADEQAAGEQAAGEQDADKQDADEQKADKPDKPSPGLVDVANFYGPFEVRESAGRGRGLFLTKAVSAGDLILCEKALAYNRRPMTALSTTFAPVIEVQVMGADVDQLDKAEISAQLHQKLLHNPDKYRPILDLFAGPKFERTKIPRDAEPVIDAFLVRSIIEFNTIEIPVGLPPDTHPPDGSKSDRPRERPPSEGVWLRASYMNHACYANCERNFIGDVVVVRAAQDLPAGAELTVAYVDTTPFNDKDRNPDAKLRRWAFSCTCDLCHARQAAFARDDRYRSSSDPAARARGPSLLAAIKEARRNIGGITSVALVPACERLDAMYPEYAGPRRAPCPETWQLLGTRLWQLLYARSSGSLPIGPMSYIDAVAAGLRSMAFDVVYSRDGFSVRRWGMVAPKLPLYFQILHGEYRQLNHRVCPAIREYARVAFRILVGEDETFAQCYPALNSSSA